MNKSFARWAKKQNIPTAELAKALKEVENGLYEVSMGGHIIKKRIRFQGKGRVGVEDQLFAISVQTGHFLFMVLLRMKNKISHRKNF